jgi:hypothetical protein
LNNSPIIAESNEDLALPTSPIIATKHFDFISA